MLHHDLASHVMRIQRAVRTHNIPILEDPRWLRIPFPLLHLRHNLLKRDIRQREFRRAQHLTMEQTEMHTGLHLHHGVEVLQRLQPPKPPSLQHPPASPRQGDGFKKNRVPDEIKRLVESPPRLTPSVTPKQAALFPRDLRSAHLSQPSKPLLTPRGSRHDSAGVDGEVQRRLPNGAGGAADEYALPPLYVQDGEETRPRRAVDLGQRRELLPGQRGVEGDHVARCDGHVLAVTAWSIAPEPAHHGGDLAADGEAVGLCW